MTKLKIDTYRIASGTQRWLLSALNIEEIAKNFECCLKPGKVPGPDRQVPE